MKYFVSVTKGWLVKRRSQYAESRQIQMQTLQKCLFLRRHLENSCDDSTSQDQILLVQSVWLSQTRCWWNQNANPTSPLKNHSREKSHKSSQSDASFRVSYLRKHLNTHSGVKAHECNQCDYSYAQASIWRHIWKLNLGRNHTYATLYLYVH